MKSTIQSSSFVMLLILIFRVNFCVAQAPARIKPTENLVVKNIPEIPASLVSDVRQYTESRSASPVDWHPLKREMLMVTRFGNTSQLHYIKFPGGARTQMTFFEEPVGNATFEPIKGDYFIFSRDAGGNEFDQLYRCDVSDGAITLLTDGGRSQNGNIRWNNKKNMISFTSTKRNGTDRDIYTMDPHDPSKSKLTHEVKGGGWSVTDWSMDDQSLLIQERLSVNLCSFYILDRKTNGKKSVGPVSSKEEVVNSGAQFSKDGKYIFFVTDFDNEFKRLARMKIDGSEIKYLTTEIKWDIHGIVLEENGKRALFSANEGGITRIYLLNTENLEWKPINELPVGLLGSFSWRKNSDEFFFTYSSAKNNSDIYSHDLKTGKSERWTQSELGGIVEKNLTDAKLIKWKSFDDTEISGFYFAPSEKFTGKRPVIINIHGGPEGQSLPVFQGRNNYFLEELGVAIIYPNE